MHHSTREPHGPRDQKAHREPREPNDPEAHRGASRERETRRATVAYATDFGALTHANPNGTVLVQAPKARPPTVSPKLLAPSERAELKRDIKWLYSLASSHNEFAMKIEKPGNLYVPPRYKAISGKFLDKLESLTAIRLKPVGRWRERLDSKGNSILEKNDNYDTTPGVPPVQYEATLLGTARKTVTKKLLRLFFIYVMLLKANVCHLWKSEETLLNKQIVTYISSSNSFALWHTTETKDPNGNIVDSRTDQLIDLADDHMGTLGIDHSDSREDKKKKKKGSALFEKLHVAVGLDDLFNAYRKALFVEKYRELNEEDNSDKCSADMDTERLGSSNARRDLETNLEVKPGLKRASKKKAVSAALNRAASVANNITSAHTSTAIQSAPPLHRARSFHKEDPRKEDPKVVYDAPSLSGSDEMTASDAAPDPTRVACLTCGDTEGIKGIIAAGAFDKIKDSSAIDAYATIITRYLNARNDTRLWSWLKKDKSRALIVYDDDRSMKPVSLIKMMPTDTKINLWKLKSGTQDLVFGIYESGHSPVGIDKAKLPLKPYDPSILVIGKLSGLAGQMKSETRIVVDDANPSEVTNQLPNFKTIVFASIDSLHRWLKLYKKTLVAWIADPENGPKKKRSIVVYVTTRAKTLATSVAYANATLLSMTPNGFLVCTQQAKTGAFVRLSKRGAEGGWKCEPQPVISEAQNITTSKPEADSLMLAEAANNDAILGKVLQIANVDTIANAAHAATKPRVACLQLQCNGGGIITGEHEDISVTSDIENYDTIVIRTSVEQRNNDLPNWLGGNANRALIVVYDEETHRAIIPASLYALHKMATEVNMHLWKLTSTTETVFGIYITDHDPVGIDADLLPPKPYDPTILVVGQLPADMMIGSEPRMVDALSTEVHPDLPYCKTIMFASHELFAATSQKLMSLLIKWINADQANRSIIVFVKVSHNKGPTKKTASAANVENAVMLLGTMRQGQNASLVYTRPLTTGMLVRLGAPQTGEDKHEWECESPSSKPVSGLLDANKDAVSVKPAAVVVVQAPAPVPAPVPAPAPLLAPAPVPAEIAFFRSNTCTGIPNGLLSSSASVDLPTAWTDSIDLVKYKTIVICGSDIDVMGNTKIWSKELEKWLTTSAKQTRALIVVYDDDRSMKPASLKKIATRTNMDLWKLTAGTQHHVFGIYDSENTPVGIDNDKLPLKPYDPSVLVIGKLEGLLASMMESETKIVVDDARPSKLNNELPDVETIMFASISSLKKWHDHKSRKSTLAKWISENGKTRSIVVYITISTESVEHAKESLISLTKNGFLVCTQQANTGTFVRLFKRGDELKWKCEPATDHVAPDPAPAKVAAPATVPAKIASEIDWDQIYTFASTDGCSVYMADGQTIQNQSIVRSVLSDNVILEDKLDDASATDIVVAVVGATKTDLSADLETLATVLNKVKYRALVVVVNEGLDSDSTQHAMITLIARIGSDEDEDRRWHSAEVDQDNTAYVFATGDIRDVPWLRADLTFEDFADEEIIDLSQADPPEQIALPAGVPLDGIGDHIVLKSKDATWMDRTLATSKVVFVLCGESDWVTSLRQVKGAFNTINIARVFHIIRADDNKVVVIRIANPEHIPKKGPAWPCPKWVPTVHIELVGVSNDAPTTIKGEDGSHHTVQCWEASYAAKCIREMGIMSALDYISATKTANIASICTQKSETNGAAELSAVQELVYLTMDTKATVRIFALAPGSGKTRAIGIALFVLMREYGADTKIGIIISDNTTKKQMDSEIMSSTACRGKPLVTHTTNGGDSAVGMFMAADDDDDDDVDVNKINDDETKAVDALIVQLNAHGVVVKYIGSCREGGVGDLATCRVIIADECHEVVPRIKEFTSCKHFFGFSGTPFDAEQDAQTLLDWHHTKEAEKRAENSGSQLDLSDPPKQSIRSFVQRNVVSVDQHAVLSILPYGNLHFRVLTAERETRYDPDGKILNHVSITVPLIGDECADVIEGLDSSDSFATDDFEAASIKVIQTIMDKALTRSLVVVTSKAAAVKFKDLALQQNAAFVFADTKVSSWLTDIAGSTKDNVVFLDTGEGKRQSSLLRDTFSAIVANNPYPPYRAIVSNKTHEVEYLAIRNTFIVGIPGGHTGPKVLLQARNRGFRMCSHYRNTYEKNHDHTIHYVVVKRPLLGNDSKFVFRGAHTIAMAHMRDGDESDVMKHAYKLTLDRLKKPGIAAVIKEPEKTWLSDQSTTLKAVCNTERGSAYVKAALAGSAGFADFTYSHVSVLDLASAQNPIVTHDERVRAMLGKVVPTASKVNPLKFDAGPSPVPFHHSLRGIAFLRADATPTDADKKNGDLVLKYENERAQTKIRDGTVLRSLAETSATIVDALSSYEVFCEVKRVYYVHAHRIKCKGHARFECFRAIGAESMQRHFVGSATEFASFIGLLSADAAYGRPPCSSPTGAQVTPMMIAAAIRPMLLRSAKVEVKVTDSDYGKKLAPYLTYELFTGAWNPAITLVAIDTQPSIAVVITVTESGADTSRSVSVDDAMLLAHTVTVQFKHTNKAKTYHDGTLVIYKDQVEYDASNLKALPPVGSIATVDIRDQKPFKSNASDLHSVVCKLAVLVGAGHDQYDVARVVADTYSFLIQT